MKELNAKIKELRELTRMADEIGEMIDGIKDEIKAVMTEKNVDTLTGADWKVTWKTVTQSRLDSKKLEADLGDLSEYKNVTTYRRFTLS